MSDENRSKERRQIVRAWTLVAQTGLIVITSAAIGLGVGLFIDHRFSLKYMPATIILSLWGLISGFVRAYQLVKHQLGRNSEDDIAGVYDRLKKEPQDFSDEDLDDDDDDYR